MKRIILQIILLLVTIGVEANYSRRLTSKNGLSHQEVQSIIQDSLGRIWMGTRNGVNIFDGNKIISRKMFLTEDSTRFYVKNVKILVSDSVGDVFLLSPPCVIKYHIKANSFQVLPFLNITTLCSYQGKVYAAHDGGVHILNSADCKLELVKSFSCGEINRMMFDKKGALWFSTRKGVFLYRDGKTRLMVSYNDVCSFRETSDGSVWAASLNKGLARWKNYDDVCFYTTANSSSKGLKNDFVRDMAEDKDGNLWFSTFKGLYKYDLSKDVFERYHRNKLFGELSEASIHPVCIDKNYNIWVGPYLNGVYSFSTLNKSLNFYEAVDSRSGLSHNMLCDITEDRDGRIWICTDGGGLNCFDPKHNTFRHFRSSDYGISSGTSNYMPQNNVMSILYDSVQNVMYVGTSFNGLYKYDIERDKFIHVPLVEKQKRFSVFSMSLAGGKLAVSTNRRLHLYDTHTGKDSVFFSVNSSFYRYISKQDDKKFYFVHNGVNEYDCETQTVKPRLVLPNVVYFFLKASNGYIYMTSHGGGVYRWNPKDNSVEELNGRMGGVAKFCYRIAELQSGHIIITCDEGVAIIDKEGNLLKLLRMDDTVPLGALTKECGLYVASDGIVYLGSTHGLLTFREEEILRKSSAGELYFSDLYVQNRRILPNEGNGIMDTALPFAKEITLPYGQNRVDIHLASKDNVVDGISNTYKYRLESLEEEWNSLSNNVITYTNLPSGEYTLRVVSDSKELTSAECISLKINVLFPWYRTWWAYLIWFGIGMLLVWLVVKVLNARHRAKEAIMLERMEKDKMQAINEAKFQFFTNVSHEFKTPLTLIIGQIEQLIDGYKLPPVLTSKLLKIMKYSHQLGDLVTELIEYRKYNKELFVLNVQKCSANNFFNNIYTDFKELAEKKLLSFNYEPCKEDVEIYIDEKQMSKVVRNLLSNAFKFTPEGGSVTLRVWTLDDCLQFSVTDTGKGIAQADIEKVFDRFFQDKDSSSADMEIVGSGVGLSLTKDIVDQHKGTIEVHSEVGKGTVFTVTIKLGKDHLDNIMLHQLEDEKENLIDETEIEVQQIEPVENYWGAETEKPTILIAEDNPNTLEILTSLFEPFYKVKTAMDGEQGYAMAREENPDLILSDWIMPKMSGTELCKQIKNDINLCHIPVVLLTALNLPEQQMEGLLCGADDYVSKPFNSKLLLARCNNIIHLKKLIYQKLSKQVQSDLSLCATNRLDKQLLDKVTVYMDEHLSDDGFNIDSLSAYVNMSRSSFYNKFKSLTGMTPNDYINNYRLKKAAMWLVQYKDKSINEISDELGFSTHNYFSTKFKERYGVTPLQYRKQNG